MKAVKTQSWNSSEYQNLKLSLQREINPKPHLNTAPVFIISATDATFRQPKIYFTLGFFTSVFMSLHFCPHDTQVYLSREALPKCLSTFHIDAAHLHTDGN